MGKDLVSIILATYNEKENINTTIYELFHNIYRNAGYNLEVIVIDDDSPDGTADEVERLNYPGVKLIRRIGTRGLASAFNRGIIESHGTIVGWMDADMCMPPSLVPKMIRAITEKGYDIAIGSRYVEDGSDLRHPLRVFSSWLINNFAGLVLGFDIKDYDSGFIVLKRGVFNKVTLIPTGYGAYFIEFVYACKKKGFKIKEMPYKFKDRTKGVSKSAPNILRFFVLGLGYVSRIIVTRLKRH